ncbi:MAG: phosphatase PAP2 family protein [Phycisphaerae bacterium]|jgi:undecaprenyl-diphosphatase
MLSGFDAAQTRRLDGPAWQTGQRLSATADSRVEMVAVAWLLALTVALSLDGALSLWLPEAVQPGTVFRRLLKLSEKPFRWWSFIVLGVILVSQPGWRRRLVGFGVTVFGCVASLHLLKFLIGRARPDLDAGPLCLCPLGDPRLGFDSFPSGHSAQAVLLAGLLALYIPRTWWVAAPLAALTCLSRLVLGRHFPSDVIAGVGLALLWIYLGVWLLGPTCFTRLERPLLSRRSSAPPAAGPEQA